MSNIKESSSDFIWNIVGVLAALTLIYYMIASVLNLQTGPFIPLTGGGIPDFIQSQNSPPVEQEDVSPTDQTQNETAATEIVSAANTQTAVDSPSQTPSSTATSAPTNTAIPSPTNEPFPLVVADFGLESQFTLHQLQPGESYTYLAELYNTTPDIIESLNFKKEGKSLWVGQYVVVIPGLQTAPTDMPLFFVLQIYEATSLIELAIQYGVSVEELRYFNTIENAVTTVLIGVIMIPVHVD